MNIHRHIQNTAGILLVVALLTGCGEKPPIKIGFIAGISGRVTDLGTAGRNGAMLAVEQINQTGGIDGHKIELLIRDDEQNAETAKRNVQELIQQKVVAIIGPMTSSMCAAVIDLANTAQTTLISPTCTSTAFSDKDDHFFRVISATTDYARKSADYQLSLGHRRLAVIYDKGNSTYTESWLNDFKSHFSAKGGKLVNVLSFSSSPDTPFADHARDLLEIRSDTILMIANSVDAAMLAQQIRRLDEKIPLAVSEWAGTERLIELAGKAVEGMTLAQFLDRDSMQPEYQAFKTDFKARFNQEPGFAGVSGYDATKVVLDSLAGKPASQPLKQRILEKRVFQGVSGKMEFTSAGDAARTTYIVNVKDGRFQTQR